MAGLFDLACDFAQKPGASIPRGAAQKVKLRVYNNMGDKVGTARPVGPIGPTVN